MNEYISGPISTDKVKFTQSLINKMMPYPECPAQMIRIVLNVHVLPLLYLIVPTHMCYERFTF